MELLKAILDLDRQCFELLNNGFHNAFFDNLMLWWREKENWIPFYILLVLILFLRFGKKAAWLILFTLLAVGISDQLSSSVIKPWVGRLRPCQEPELFEHIRLLLKCGSGKSFTSSHAANHMTVSVVLALGLKQWYPKAIWAFIFWAISIGFAQIYVGLHYPGDVLAGFLLGGSIGWISYKVLSRVSPFYSN
ncbi:MAG: undecaprenyl-diphosphatase [Limisphaerales bacterium]